MTSPDLLCDSAAVESRRTHHERRTTKVPSQAMLWTRLNCPGSVPGSPQENSSLPRPANTCERGRWHRVIAAAKSAYHYPLIVKHLWHAPLLQAADQEIVYRDLKRFTYREPSET